MPLRTPEKKSPLSGDGRLLSSPAESEGATCRQRQQRSYIYGTGGERKESLPRIGPARMREVALSRLKTCCVRMFGEICSSQVSSVIESPFLVADSMPGFRSTRAERQTRRRTLVRGPQPHRRALASVAMGLGLRMSDYWAVRGAVCCTSRV
jgi:hypothetical protein